MSKIIPTKQCSSFNPQQETSLKLLQQFLHHKNLNAKGLPPLFANSTTEERIKRYNILNTPLTPSQESELRKSSKTISNWVWQNKAALYKIVYRVTVKNRQMLDNCFYDEAELFNILFLEAVRTLYNYKFDNPKQAKPLTYLLHILNIRKHDLLALPTPFSEEAEDETQLIDCHL